MLSSWNFLKTLLGLHLQPGMSFSMLMQLNFVVILVMAQNCNALVHRVIVWKLDIGLSSERKQKNFRSVTLGRV